MSRSATDPLKPGPAGFAHRGLHGAGVPENSLAAFRAAAELGCGAECDVRLSFDGVPMLFHDPKLQRLCGSAEAIAACDSGWLAEQRLLGTEQKIAPLWQLLERWPAHLPLLIECKTQDGNARAMAHAFATAIAETGDTNIAVMSFDPDVAAELAEAAPEQRRGLVVDRGWSEAMRHAAVEQARPHFLAIDRSLAGGDWAQAMRARVPVYAWTVRTAEDRAALSPAVDALIWEGDGRP